MLRILHLIRHLTVTPSPQGEGFTLSSLNLRQAIFERIIRPCHPELTTRVILSGVRLRTQSKPVGLPSVATVGSRVVKIDFLSMTRTKIARQSRCGISDGIYHKKYYNPL